jgi:DNA polymerase delta subunit 1
LRKSSAIVGTHVLNFESEKEMLLAWRVFVQKIDPDIMTGYNIENFDFKYLMERSAKLKVFNLD